MVNFPFLTLYSITVGLFVYVILFYLLKVDIVHTSITKNKTNLSSFCALLFTIALFSGVAFTPLYEQYEKPIVIESEMPW
jgi:hypothetical protein